MGLIEFTQPGYEVAALRVGSGTTRPAHSVPPARFKVRADLIIAIEEPAEADDFVVVRTSIEKWEVTESYATACALWESGLIGGAA